MNQRDPKKTQKSTIRQLAEQKLGVGVDVDLTRLTPDEIRRVVHELQVHQVELEIQNDQLEEAQREAELSTARYRHLYEAAPIAYLTLDADGVVDSVNPCGDELLQVPHLRLVGRRFSDFVSPMHQDRWHFVRQALLDGGERRSLELSLVLDDGKTIEVGLTASIHLDSHRVINLGMLDLTELRRAERELRKAAAEVSLAEQRERRKLASELHDDAGQLISLASIKLGALRKAPVAGRDGKLAEVIELMKLVRKKITSLSFQMSPPLLHDVGLLAATRWLAEDLGRTYHLVVTVPDGPEVPLDEVSRVILFQAIRELLLNVKKHAQVDEARVQIEGTGSTVRVTVEDSGIGFSSDADRESLGHQDGVGGFGLLALRERLAQLGGSIAVASNFGGAGTRVVIDLPIQPIEGEPK